MPPRRRGLIEDELAMVAGVTLVLMCLGAVLLSIAACFR
jgi:hypothetical protein